MTPQPDRSEPPNGTHYYVAEVDTSARQPVSCDVFIDPAIYGKDKKPKKEYKAKILVTLYLADGTESKIDKVEAQSKDYIEYERKFYENAKAAESHELRYADHDGEWAHEDNVRHCDGMNEYFLCEHHDYVVTMDNQIFRNEDVATAHDYRYYDGDGEWYQIEDEVFNEGEGSHCLQEYGENNYGDKSGDSRYKIGFEVEKEDDSFSADYHDVEGEGWTIECDGSLDDYTGFELKSPILPLDNLDTVFEQIDKMKQYVDAKYSSHCGGHIHISDTKRTPRQILEQIRGYEPLIFAMYPFRTSENYCKPKKFAHYAADDQKYQALALTGDTLEIRVFPSPKNTHVLKFRTELLKYMLENPAKTAKTVAKRMMKKGSGLRELLLRVYSPKRLEKKAKLLGQIERRKEAKGNQKEIEAKIKRETSKQTISFEREIKKTEIKLTELKKNKKPSPEIREWMRYATDQIERDKKIVKILKNKSGDRYSGIVRDANYESDQKGMQAFHTLMRKERDSSRKEPQKVQELETV